MKQNFENDLRNGTNKKKLKLTKAFKAQRKGSETIGKNKTQWTIRSQQSIYCRRLSTQIFRINKSKNGTNKKMIFVR